MLATRAALPTAAPGGVDRPGTIWAWVSRIGCCNAWSLSGTPSWLCNCTPEVSVLVLECTHIHADGLGGHHRVFDPHPLRNTTWENKLSIRRTIASKNDQAGHMCRRKLPSSVVGSAHARLRRCFKGRHGVRARARRDRPESFAELMRYFHVATIVFSRQVVTVPCRPVDRASILDIA